MNGLPTSDCFAMPLDTFCLCDFDIVNRALCVCERGESAHVKSFRTRSYAMAHGGIAHEIPVLYRF